MASRTVTYALWLFGGWAGLHHVYLGRVDQALTYVMTLAGLGVAWLRDFSRIPDYIAWTNGDKEFQKRLYHKKAADKGKSVSCSTFRSSGMITLGSILASVLCGLVPPLANNPSTSAYYCWFGATYTLAVLGATLGVYLVANIGEFQCSLLYPLGGALLGTPWLVYNPSSCTVVAALSGVATSYMGMKWRPAEIGNKDKRGSLCRNMAVYAVCASLWVCVLVCGVYFNGQITIEKGGEKIPVREVIDNFLKSDAWRQTKESLKMIYDIYKHRGFKQAYEDLMGKLDFHGGRNALKVVGLDKSATQQEITKRCRQLAREFHPDKYREETKKQEAQERFIEIQAACSKLSNVKHKRARMNRRRDVVDDVDNKSYFDDDDEDDDDEWW